MVSWIQIVIHIGSAYFSFFSEICTEIIVLNVILVVVVIWPLT